MKICVTAVDNNLESQVDPRFGRCQFFIIWDSDSDEYEVVKNNHSTHGLGVGVQAAQLVVSKGASVIITGEVGPKAEGILKTADIETITGASGTVRDALKKYGKTL